MGHARIIERRRQRPDNRTPTRRSRRITTRPAITRLGAEEVALRVEGARICRIERLAFARDSRLYVLVRRGWVVAVS